MTEIIQKFEGFINMYLNKKISQVSIKFNKVLYLVLKTCFSFLKLNSSIC